MQALRASVYSFFRNVVYSSLFIAAKTIMKKYSLCLTLFSAAVIFFPAGIATSQTGNATAQTGNTKVQIGTAKVQTGNAKAPTGNASAQTGNAKVESYITVIGSRRSTVLGASDLGVGTASPCTY